MYLIGAFVFSVLGCIVEEVLNPTGVYIILPGSISPEEASS